MEDFPAAHSMDTCWFAVDGDGNIGFFDSGDEGAVPEISNALQREANGLRYSGIHSLFKAWSQQNGDRLVHLTIPANKILRSFGINPKSDISIENPNEIPSKIFPLLKSNSWIDEDAISSYQDTQRWGWSDPHWLLVIDDYEAESLKIIKSHALRNEDYIIHFFGKPTVFFIPHCPMSTLEMLLKKGYLQFALPLGKYEGSLANLFGLFTYENNYCCSYVFPSYVFPYERTGKPIHPLKLEDLPETLQDVLTWNWFETNQFAKHRKIQPLEHTKCRTWNDLYWWIDTRGMEREGHPHD